MTDSQSLRLVFLSAAVHERLVAHVADELRRAGYADVTPSKLSFLGALDCGVNYGADIARQLNVSRQLVARTVKELCLAGYLEQVAGPGKQKQILFTAAGERLMAAVRQQLAHVDGRLHQRVGEAALTQTLSVLGAVTEAIETRDGR
ncbi:MAG: MarR family winged helix-turn-helix transcriptional regulator [Vicinamibacterales bacterium]|nr:MarR family winged helix-turn-helix transcriptional regulator [Vicinamibacterales bacterium]